MNKDEVLRIFENLTIAQLKQLTLEFLTQNPEIPTALQLLNKLHRDKEAEKIRAKKTIELFNRAGGK